VMVPNSARRRARVGDQLRIDCRVADHLYADLAVGRTGLTAARKWPPVMISRYSVAQVPKVISTRPNVGRREGIQVDLAVYRLRRVRGISECRHDVSGTLWPSVRSG